MSDCTESGHGHSHSHSHDHGSHRGLLLVGGVALLAVMRHKRRMALAAAEGGEEPRGFAPWMARGMHGAGMHRAFAGRHGGFGRGFGHGFGAGEDVTEL